MFYKDNFFNMICVCVATSQQLFKQYGTVLVMFRNQATFTSFVKSFDRRFSFKFCVGSLNFQEFESVSNNCLYRTQRGFLNVCMNVCAGDIGLFTKRASFSLSSVFMERCHCFVLDALIS